MIEMKNEGESLIYNTEKQIRENDAKLPQDIKDRIRADITSVNEAISSNNKENLKTNLVKLRNSAMEMGRSIYQNASQSQSQDQSQSQSQDSGSSQSQDGQTHEQKKEEDKKP